MALYDVVDGIYRKVAKKYDPVEGVYRKVKKAFDPVDGVYRQYYIGGTPISSLAVGDSVWLNVDGVQTEFLVVHQGNPDSALYDASCDGTWLLMKYVGHNVMAWDSSNNDYEKSDIHAYLNGTFHGMLDSDIQSAIKQVKLPYHKGTGSSGSVSSGSSGLSTKIFLLAGYEIGLTTNTTQYLPVDGAKLSYFESGTGTSANNKRIAYYDDGVVTIWWLRSPATNRTNRAFSVNISGICGSVAISNEYTVRAAFILDSNTPIDQSTGINIIL